jgi:transcriptional regulator NrdR family protein
VVNCPKCESSDTVVIDDWLNDNSVELVRRKCESCGTTYVTVEDCILDYIEKEEE